MPPAALLDSARHKLRLARYHAETLTGILQQQPHDGPDEPLRVPLEAHLEGLAYAGTAAAEKTIRSVDPDDIRSGASIAQMIRQARDAHQSEEARTFAAAFEQWWTGRERGTRFCELARDLRNDAAHNVYEKGPDGPYWRVRVGRHDPVALDDLIPGYLRELDELEALVAQAEALAAAPAG